MLPCLHGCYAMEHCTDCRFSAKVARTYHQGIEVLAGRVGHHVDEFGGIVAGIDGRQCGKPIAANHRPPL